MAYSGTEFDKNWIKCLWKGVEGGEGVGAKLFMGFAMLYPLADLPFSFLADTVLFPVDKTLETGEENFDASICGAIKAITQ